MQPRREAALVQLWPTGVGRLDGNALLERVEGPKLSGQSRGLITAWA